MPKTAVRPPRKPKGESAKITIAVQNRQIETLVARCEKLNELLTAANLRIDGLRQDITSHVDAGDALCRELRSVKESYTRLLGWQDCAREIINNRFPTL
jgi:hypothetical protein